MSEVYASKVEYDSLDGNACRRKAQVVKTMDAYKERLHLFEFGDTLPGNVVAMEQSVILPVIRFSRVASYW